MGSFWHLQHNLCCIVVDTLQLVDGSHWSSVKHHVVKASAESVGWE